MKKSLLFILAILFMNNVFGQSQVIQLWTAIPNSNSNSEEEKITQGDIVWIEYVHTPTMEVFLPSKQSATGVAVLICPGGGYQGLSYDWEGTDVAKWLNGQGIAAFVLKSRLPKSKSIITPHQAPLQDAQRAMRLIRANADKWNINPAKVGVMGFSAGGHLAATLGTLYNQEVYAFQDDVDTISAKPDFMGLVYPVITMLEECMHVGSRDNLLGDNPDDELAALYSAERNVNEQTSPTILVHASDDKAVPSENSILFYQALLKYKVDAELHIYNKGGHGFGLATKQGKIGTWIERFEEWIIDWTE